MKAELVQQPVLALPLPLSNSAHAMDNDFFDEKMSCVLLQEQPDSINRLIGFWSHLLHVGQGTH